jgi:3-oxoacyl-[acyl-carrier-protein] synthase II
MKRVVVTGVGLVSPLGCGSEAVWGKIVKGARGIRRLPEVSGSWPSDATKPRSAAISVVALVPSTKDIEDNDDVTGFDAESAVGRGASRDKSRFIQYSLHASDLALAHAGLTSTETDGSSHLGIYDRNRIGVAIASGIGAINEIIEGGMACEKSERKLSPYFVPKILINMAAGQVSLRHDFRGPNHSVATACAAGAHAIGDAFNFIRLGYADMMLCGGSEACVGALGVAGFGRMRALSTSDDPYTASRPFHPDRDGFVIGEGAATLVLEEMDMALKRGAPIIAELAGYGLSGDAYHSTSPSPEGSGAIRAMRGALACASLEPSAVDYINAHATSTPTGDGIELSAIGTVFGTDTTSPDDGVLVSSTKGATGHMLGAAGAFEGAITALATRDGLLPPSLGLVEDDGSDVHVELKDGVKLVTGERALVHDVQCTMSNSFGFGGTNASLVFKRFTEKG